MTTHAAKPHKILILSPHRDDAAFSLALSIQSWLRRGHPVTILNAFTRSLYAPFSDAESVHENDRLSYVSAMRKKEDEAFLRHVPGATMQDLNIKDAPLRLHCSADVVCDMPLNPLDGAFAKIAKPLAKIASTGNVALILPLALGHHVDHRVARDAALPLSATLPCAFYEDLPYATREGVSVDLDRFRQDINSRYHKHLAPVICPHASTTAWKHKVCLLYASQIERESAGLITDFSQRYQGNERIWANEAFLALVETERLGHADTTQEPLPA